MTADLIKVEQFQDIPVRVVQQDGRAMIPLVDIAEAIGYDRSALTKILKRNEGLFEGLTSRQYLSTQRGDRQETICLSKEGVVGLLMRAQPSRAKSEDYEKKIVAFQRWAIETLSKIIGGEIAPARHLDEDVREALKVARIISEETGISLGIAQSFALEKAGAGDWQKLLPASSVPTGYLIPTGIGHMIGRSAREVNMWLYQYGYQIKDSTNPDAWRLTEKGRLHAEEFPFTKGGHSGYQIKWKNSILAEMNIRTLSTAAQAPG